MTRHLHRTAIFLGFALVVMSPLPAIYHSFDGRWTEAMISQSLGTVSLMCMIVTVLLSARPPGMNLLLKGIDKLYVVHMWLGLVALVTLVLHDSFDPEVDDLDSEVTLWGVDWGDLGADLGGWSYDALLILLAITFIRFIPYRWWYLTHRAMVVVFALAIVHFLTVAKPISLGDAGGLYLTAWCLAGLVAAALALRPAALRGGVAHRVAARSEAGETNSYWLEPAGPALPPHKAGQFVTLRGASGALAEWHPFTLSSASEGSGRVRVTISRCSRWTRWFADQIGEGDTVYLRGPYGRFLPGRGTRRQVWLSAGVGITPFLAWARSGMTPRGPVDILHICRDRSEVPHLADLARFADRHDSVTLKVYETRDRGRPTARDLSRLLRDRPETVDLYFCGPAGLREALGEAVARARKARFDIHEEAFEFRSPLPVPRWLRAALQSLTQAGREAVGRG